MSSVMPSRLRHFPTTVCDSADFSLETGRIPRAAHRSPDRKYRSPDTQHGLLSCTPGTPAGIDLSWGVVVARSTPLAPMIGPDAVSSAAGAPIRSPKTAELVAGTLRRMVVDGRLKEGDYLPNEAELMAHFGVSRPTLREAVRVLESERLVEVRRGSRTGARVRVPGPEIVARPAGLLLELSGATIADVMV